MNGNKIFDVSELFRCYCDLFSIFFRCFVSMFSLFMFCLFRIFAFLCFVVLCFVIDPLFARCMAQDLHSKPHLNTKHEDWTVFHND